MASSSKMWFQWRYFPHWGKILNNMYFCVSLCICVTFYAGKCILGLSNNIESVCINLVSISYRDDHIHTNGIRPKSKMDACNFNHFFFFFELSKFKSALLLFSTKNVRFHVWNWYLHSHSHSHSIWCNNHMRDWMQTNANRRCVENW